MTKAKAPDKLSSLGTDAEALLTVVLKDMRKDMKLDAGARKYSLTDQMRVLDRIAKFESIRSRMTDEEGGFFTEPESEDVGDEPDEAVP